MELNTDRQLQLEEIIISNIPDINKCDRLQISELAFAWSMLEFMNGRILKVPSLISDRQFMSSRDKFTGEVCKLSSALNLNRAQRQKIVNESNSDPLVDLLGG